ncbi:MAG: bifunctional diaminohydroxyphosphoribosylaminopyrimidine deaminase/5-amino-6-(5-phosphoribosylamino)uracil reductase RibD [Fimbriimonas sp.]|nr:bifunctional diaminohydroxyphosphoribosylaminopyrimidine deaminase/5-amino-6-(5-phosphoribosylamino)uracil reductase RibD [Fimbriimonas sp.]
MMRRAISLAKRGYPAPNPHVGCVIARGDHIVGEGFHRFAGGPHAEVNALTMSGEHAMGATAYVTLEPCDHHGRTPPCTEALMRGGISRLVVACLDPNPVASGGLTRLAAHGIVCESGLLCDEARVANVRFMTAMVRRRPYVVVKVAASLDGRIAMLSGESQWITGPDARRAGHRLRAECGAVLVGRGTVESDDPRLTARLAGVINQPTRVVLDPYRKLGPHWQVFDTSAPCLHLFEGAFGLKLHDAAFDLNDVCALLFNRGITGLLVEGGGETITRFLRADLVDRIEMFVAPKILGSGRPWVGDLQISTLADAPQFRVESVKKLSGDLRITLTR